MLSNRVIVVTGGAGGIGQAAAESFVSLGARVVSLDIAPFPTAGECRLSDSLLHYQVNHEDSDAVADVVAEVIARWGKIDGLFCNAGRGFSGELAEVDAPGVTEAFTNHVIGAMNVTKGALPFLLREAETGNAATSIVYTSSRLGLKARPSMLQYVVAKHALQGLMKSVAEDYGPRGIRVNSVCPGMVKTKVARDMVASYGGDEEETYKQLAQQYPLKRLVEPVEVANAVAFLLSPMASAIHGHSLLVDCGAHST